MPLDVHVVSPEREVWSGEAEMVVAKGVDGDVGILAGHAPMLISLSTAPLRVIRPGAEDQAVLIDGGFLHVTQTTEGTTRVDILAEHAELPSEVDVAAARARVEELQRRVDAGETDAEADLRRALLRADHAAG